MFGDIAIFIVLAKNVVYEKMNMLILLTLKKLNSMKALLFLYKTEVHLIYFRAF